MRQPKRELTVEEIDAEIERSGRSLTLAFLPEGPLREAIRDQLRFTVRLERCEEIADGIVWLPGENAFISPMNDIEWNFDKFHLLMDRVFEALSAGIIVPQR